ncbi:MAG: UvrB/UvrC motif-containing protein [Isosphaeraceae bacterium]
MSKDIRPVLAGWDFEPGEHQVRIVTGDDGLDKIQLRLDLGLLQMEMNGRPDGQRPEGFESWLDAHEAFALRAEERGERYRIGPRECGELLREGYQYYHRYLAAYHLQRFDLVSRDTERNLRLFAFARRHAERTSDGLEFDQYRPYVLMMRSRARAQMALGAADYPSALAAIDEGIEGIRQFLRDHDHDEADTVCRELAFLKRWRREVETERPVGPVERLEQQLALAVAREQYEEAARLRDQLRRLRPAPTKRSGSP